MAFQKLRVPIKGYAYQNVEDIEKKTQPHRIVNMYCNEAEHYVKRAGLLIFADLGTALKVQGMYYWREKNVVVAVSNQNVYKITSAGVVTNITGDQLSGNNRPIFSECLKAGVMYLVITDGTRIISWDGTGTTTLIADADAPTACKSIAFLDGYLLATNNNNSFYSSNWNVFDDWHAIDEWVADTNPEDIDMIVIAYREIYLFGKSSIEVWRDTGSSLIFERVLGAEMQDGCIAPYTIKEDDGAIYYFNKERKVIKLEGRSRGEISVPLNKVLAGYSTISDATGDIVVVDGKKFYLLQFPTEGASWACDLQNNFGWAEWKYWDVIDAEYELFRGACALYVPDWGKTLIGDRANGLIYVLDPATTTDNTASIRYLIRSGHIDHDTTNKKSSRKLMFKVKRGVATVSEADPVMMVRWNDDNTGFITPEAWTSLGLGQTGVEEFYVHLNRCGMYRARQYEIAGTDNVQFILCEIDEEVEVLEH